MAKRKRDPKSAGDDQAKYAKKGVCPPFMSARLYRTDACYQESRASEHTKRISLGNENPPKASLLGMPGEIRNHIFRLSLLEDEQINVNQAGSNLEPGLLRCCHAIRHEARPIFCEENTFDVIVYNCRMTNHVNHWIWRDDLVPDDNLSIFQEGRRSWSALKALLRSYKHDAVSGFVEDVETMNEITLVCCKAFRLVKALRDTPWVDVGAALDVFREAAEVAHGRKIFAD